MEAWEPTLTELQSNYERYYSLQCLNVPLERKYKLISLICFLTTVARKKNPSASVEQVIRKITKGSSNSPGLLRALTCICEDAVSNPHETFSCFGYTTADEIIKEINDILLTEMPFYNRYPVTDLPF